MKIYRNGIEVASSAGNMGNPGTNTFKIGSDAEGGLIDGIFDEVIIWTVGLTPSEIKNVYNMRSVSGGFGFGNPWMFLKDMREKHDKLWTPKLVLPKLGYQI
jgi:hypothetical protein